MQRCKRVAVARAREVGGGGNADVGPPPYCLRQIGLEFPTLNIILSFPSPLVPATPFG